MKRLQIRKWLILSAIFSLIVLMTWFFGYNYIRMVAHSKNLMSSEVNNQDDSEIRLNLSSLDYWTCQVGVFQSEENAVKEKDRLEELGWEAYILSENPWSVCVSYTHSKEELTAIRELLKKSGIDSIPKHFDMLERSYWIRGKGAEETAKLIEVVHNYLKSPQASQDILVSLEQELDNSFPKALNELHEASFMVVKAERSLTEHEQRVIKLRLLREYQVTLELLKK